MKTTFSHILRLVLLLAAAVLGVLPAHAGITKIDNAPMASANTVSVKPNVYFILDNSGSMNDDNLPGSSGNNDTKFCFRNHLYNGVYYNPDHTYELPVTSVGADFPNAIFTAAKVNGFDTSTTPATTDLRSAFKSGDNGPVGSANHYLYIDPVTTPVRGHCYPDTSYKKVRLNPTATTTITVNASSTTGTTGVTSIKVNGEEILSKTANATGNNAPTTQAGNIAAVVTRNNGFTATASGNIVTITGPARAAGYVPVVTSNSDPATGGMTFTIGEEFPDSDPSHVQNFANWYSYYRTRILTMKSAAGLAFKNIGNSVRVGFSTISYKGVDSNDPGFLKIEDFSSAHKSDWYAKLYGAAGNSSTPLRGALSKAGRLYAGKLLTGADDPMQYSCQQNFTILSTDGYWNTGSESPKDPSGDACITNTSASTNYGAYGLDNQTCVEQQDGTAARPMNDGAIATSTEVSKWDSVSTKVTRTTRPSVDTTKTFVDTYIQHLDTVKQRSVYSGLTLNSSANATHGPALTNTIIARSNSTPSTVTVTTSVAHGYVNGNYVTVSGANTAAYNGTYLITVASPTTFTFTLATKPNPATGALGTSVKETWANGCAIGKGKYSIKAQHYDNFKNWTGTVTTTTVTPNTIQTDTTTVVTTPKTRTVVTTNGIVTSDLTTSGTATTTTNVPPATVTTIPGTPVTTVSSAVIPTVDTPTVPVWTNFGAAATSACTTTMPASPSATTTFSTYPASPAGDTFTVLPVANTPGFPTLGVLGTTTAPQLISGPTVVDGSVTTYPAVVTSTGGPKNTLADVAMYYYQNDLRTPTLGNCTGQLSGLLSTGNTLCAPDVCTTIDGKSICGDTYNNVRGAGIDTMRTQHMTTFTLGLGVDGTLGYADNYLSGGSSDYMAISSGSKNWPDPIKNSGAERVDDLWHAAVNGRGVYYSPQDAETLIKGLSKTLQDVTARTGSAAAAATSNLEPTSGDNFLFVALYRTIAWTGDLEKRTIDPSSGAISAKPEWNAQTLLDVRTSPPRTGTNSAPTTNSDTRVIYIYSSTATNKLTPFRYANLGLAQKAYFDNMCTAPYKLSQCAALIANDAASAATANPTTTATDISGANLVNYLRGQQDFEDSGSNTTRLYRARDHVLGDMVSSQPVYVKTPPFNYADVNYGAFKSLKASRKAVVYVGANDGMLHAFVGDTGQELWAYVPPMVMGNMYRLSDPAYGNTTTNPDGTTTTVSNHRYFVDGSPTVADICPKAPTADCQANEWRTILIGGLNAGGRGYYAMDITDPDNPLALWNFTTANDPDLGLTFGNPIVTKRKDHTWVVAFTSGYNNVPGESAEANPPETTGDGNGHLYILNAFTGEMLEKIDTVDGNNSIVGNIGTPNGLAKINAKIAVPEDNTTEAFYGGDLLGNLWRFTLDTVLPPSAPVSTAGKSFLLAQLGNANGAVNQPITTKPELAVINAGSVDYTVVYIGTGQYLGDPPDRGNHDKQSVYAIKDVSTLTSGWGLVRAIGSPRGLIQQTLSNNFDINGQVKSRSTSTNAIDWATNIGWYVDLDPSNTSPGERVNVDVQLQLGSLTVAANVPRTDACEAGGYAFLYNFDFRSGKFLSTATDQIVGIRLSSDALVAGLNTVRLESGKILTIVTDTGGGVSSHDTPSSPASTGVAKRTSWRELVK